MVDKVANRVTEEDGDKLTRVESKALVETLAGKQLACNNLQ